MPQWKYIIQDEEGNLTGSNDDELAQVLDNLGDWPICTPAEEIKETKLSAKDFTGVSIGDGVDYDDPEDTEEDESQDGEGKMGDSGE